MSARARARARLPEAASASERRRAPLLQQPAREPEPAQRAGELERRVGVVCGQPVEGCPEIVVVGLETCGRLGLGVEAARVRLLGEPAEELGVSPTEIVRLAGFVELLACVLANRLEHEEAVVADGLEQAQVDERGESIELGVADLLRGGERGAAREDGESGEELLACRVEEVVAPLDRRAERALALRRVAGAAGQQGKSRVEALEEGVHAEQLRARRRQLDRQGKPVEPKADGFHRRIGRELLPDRSRALHEQRRSITCRERLEPELSLAGHAQGRTTRHENPQRARRREEARDCGSAGEQMLEVVEEEEQLLAAEEGGKVVACADGLRELRGQQLRVGEPRERHPEDAVALRADELGGDLEREARLPGSAGPRDGEEASAVREQRDELLELLLAPDERERDHGQVGRIERPQRREVAGAELVQMLGSGEVLQTVLAEVANGGVGGEELPGRLGDDDLPAVRGGRDPRRAVDVDPDVALVRRLWLTGVDSDAHADGAALERVARVGGRRHCVRCAREGNEERVALRVDLDAVVSRERFSQGAAVLREEIRVARSVLLEEPRRALDVGEEEGDGAGRKLGPGHDRAVRSRWSGPRD